MSLRTRLLPALSALLVVLVLGASAGVSIGGDTTRHEVPTSTMFASSPMLESPAADAADAAEVNQCLAPIESQETAAPSTAYECPVGQDYCQQDSQCDDQCGGFFGVCFQGCCQCAG